MSFGARQSRRRNHWKAKKDYQDACSNSTDNIIQLQTTFVKLPKLIEVLAKIMHSEPIEGLQQQYNALSYDSSFTDKFSKLLVESKEDFQKRIAASASIVHFKVDVPSVPLSQINGQKRGEANAKFVEMNIMGSIRQIEFVAYLVEQILNGADIGVMYVFSSEYPKFVTAEMSAKPKRELKNGKKYWFE
uniref:Uncharacterized protein n=1 Tax=Ditylenchus dipsaci TaxID=166011 RepID=A0A915E8Q4_9BILA